MTAMEAVRPTVASVRVSLRSDGVVMVASLVLVWLVVMGVVAAQRSIEAAEEESLTRAVAGADGDEARLRIVVADEFGAGSAGGDALAAPRAAVDAAAASIDPLVLSVYGPPRLVVDSPRFAVVEVDGAPPASPTGLVLRVHDGLDEHATRSAGSAPVPTDERIDSLAVVEAELTAATLDRLGWEIGTEALVDSDPSDPLFRVFTGVSDPFWIRVTGVVELDPPGDVFWAGDARLHRAIVADTAVGANITAYASIPPADLDDLLRVLGDRSGLRVEQRRDLVRSAIDLANVEDLERAVTSAESATASTGVPGQPAVSIGLGPVLDDESARRDVTRSAVLLATVGVMAVAIATLVQFQRVASARRRPWWRQATARGATPVSLVSSALITTTVVAGLGIVLGAVSGALVREGAEQRPANDLPWLLGLFAVALLAAVAADQVIEVRSRLRDDDTATAASSRFRRATGALVVALAIASVVTLRRRGISLDTESVDPVLLLPVVMVPLAAVVVVAAVVPRLLRGRTVGSLRLGVGRLVGVRRGLTAGSEPGLLPVLALATSVAVVGVAVATSIDRGIVDQSWRDVGGPARLDTSDGAVADRVGGPDAVVSRFGDTRVLVDRDGDITEAQLVNVDVGAHERLTAGTPAELDLPDDLGTTGGAQGSIAGVSTPEVGGRAVTVGDQLLGVGSNAALDVTVVAVVPTVFGYDRDAVLVDRAALAAQLGRPPTLDAVWFDGPVPDALAADASVRVVDRAAVAATRRDDPLTQAALVAFAVAAAGAAALGVAAVVAHLVVTMRSRRRDVGLLAALGAAPDEFGRSVRAEILPSVVIGAAVGALTAVVTVGALDGRLDLGPLTGSSGTAITAGALATVAVVLAVVLAVATTVWIAGRRTDRGRADAVAVLRAEGST